jgi:hypothetical protein
MRLEQRQAGLDALDAVGHGRVTWVFAAYALWPHRAIGA